jgi:multidrug efflux pump subunit AcrA (membrane-fusion protein)
MHCALSKRVRTHGATSLQLKNLPQFRDIGWRWIAYATSLALIVAIGFACVHEVELKQDVSCEVVSWSEIRIEGVSGRVSAVYTHSSDRVKRGAPLFQLTPNLALSSDVRASGSSAASRLADSGVTIYAPQAGVVTFSGLLPGRMLDKNEVAQIIDIDPGQPLTVALRIPSRQRGFVKPGQIIHIKLDAFPYARFGTYEARIDSISGATLRAPDGAPTPVGGAGSDNDYRALATLRGDTFNVDGQSFPILPGMRGRASIVVERRTIAEWILAPLFRMMRG